MNGEPWMTSGAILLGRILLSAMFLGAGLGKLLAPAVFQTLFAKMGLPLPEAVWLLAVVVELGGGLALLFGLFTRPVALGLAVWCIATALVAHTDFTNHENEINFFKNVAIAGGFLYVAAGGAGRFSLDAWLSRRRSARPAR